MSNEHLFPDADTAPYTLPLGRDDFRLALRLGHGRAWLHAQEHGIADRIDDVVHACLHNLSYDAQCEGDRAEWMIGMVDVAGARELVAPRLFEVIDHPPSEVGSDWHRIQRCRLLKLLVERGHDEARALLYAALGDDDHSFVLPLGGEEVIELDGVAGLIRVCECMGAQLAANSNYWVDDQLLDVFDGAHEPGAAEHHLRLEEDSNESVARYLRSLGDYRAQQDADEAGQSCSRSVDHGTADDIIAWVEAAGLNLIEDDIPGGGHLMVWGRRAPEAELARIVERLQAATEPQHIFGYLRVFQHRDLPLVDEKVLSFIHHPHARVRWVAFFALGRLADPRLREEAFRSLRPEMLSEGVLGVLGRNYQPGDHKLIEGALYLPEEVGDVHGIVSDLASAFAECQSSEITNLLLFAYEHSPCGNCRRRAIECLSTVGALPSWLRLEAGVDAVDEIRELLQSE